MSKFINKVFHSFIPALQGIISGFGERNMKVHGFITFVVILGGAFFQISQIEWLVVVLMIALVWSGELVNTAIEELSNIVRDELKLNFESTRRARDVAAGAVLMKAIVAFCVGLYIFLPKLIFFLKNKI